jgi:hypothetical protein
MLIVIFLISIMLTTSMLSAMWLRVVTLIADKLSVVFPSAIMRRVPAPKFFGLSLPR